MEENKPDQRQLIFNDDGTIDPEQLEGMPQEFIDRVTSPEFSQMAAQQIRGAKARASFERGAKQIKAQARREHVARRSPGISGRQRRLLRRAARKIARATLTGEGNG